jgi:hypothetical protein
MAFQSLEGIKVHISKMIYYLGHFEKQLFFLKMTPNSYFLKNLKSYNLDSDGLFELKFCT